MKADDVEPKLDSELAVSCDVVEVSAFALIGLQEQEQVALIGLQEQVAWLPGNPPKHQDLPPSSQNSIPHHPHP